MSVDLLFNACHMSVPEGTLLFDCADMLGVYVPTSCHRQGKCRECLVEVAEGMDLLSERTPQEEHLTDNFRLSCSTKVTGTAGTVRCTTMRRGAMQIERHARHLGIHGAAFVPDPAVTREGDRILLDGVEIDRTSGPIHGLAIDIGTTTVVVRLHNLETGDLVADTSFENPQRFGGSDVMARIRYDSERRNMMLQRVLAGYLSHAIESFPVDPQSIYETIVAGNSTMRDLFFRLDVHPIGQSPYQSVTEREVAAGIRPSTSLTSSPRRLSLPMHPHGRVYGMPIISGHIGADAAACMLAVGMMREDRLVAVMDIGTNTELLVGNRHRILAASCPAGPAFEGGRISCGMPGLPGAIESVRIADDGVCTTGVIGGITPTGICGSGLIDALGELLRTGRMNALGRLTDGEDRWVLAASAGTPIAITEADINELAQAKGANVAGLHIIFEEYGVQFHEIATFYLAGGFGRHLDVESAKRIGLLPAIDAQRIVQVGNAAIEGASRILLSRTQRQELEEAVRRVVHCRLETHPGFFHYFVEGCQFQPVESIDSISRP